MPPIHNLISSDSKHEPNILLSIILPNRGGTPYVYRTLENILGCTDSRFELVVNDNSIPDVIDYSDYLLDKRVKLFHEKEILPMSENWMHGISHAKGNWICFIGCDDGIVTEHLSDFLDFLETCRVDSVTTHGTYFQYAIDDLKPWISAPESKSSKNATRVKYPYKLEALFPQLRNEMPIPYNLAVVRNSVLRSLVKKHSRIPGIAPDDFLGQFVAQTCRRGINYDLPVFIQGNSIRSNGRAHTFGITNVGTTEFAKDSLLVQGDLVTRYGFSCQPAISLEHFIVAWEEIHARKFWIPHFLLRAWCVLTCLDSRHHGDFAFTTTLQMRKVILKFITHEIRQLWLRRNFGPSRPGRNHKVTLGEGSTILTASDYLRNL